MRKGERTKAEIIHKSAVLFNKKGYDGVSISDVMRATGLEKGGIYRHFDSKDDLALEAFDYTVDLVNSCYLAAIRASHNAQERLTGVVETFSMLINGEPIGGGCPIMNTAIDSDDGHPALRAKAKEALNTWHGMLTSVIERGIERGEIKAEVDPAGTASQIIGLMEGSLMMARITDDGEHLTRAIGRLHAWIADMRPGDK